MPFDLWITFMAASLALLLIPGPTVLLVLSYALSQGRSVALATAAGVAVGDLIAMTASLLGLGALVLASATAFTVLKWVGVAYLLYLGLQLLRSAERTTFDRVNAADGTSARAVFGHAATVTALNPKSIGFFIAFVPQFITADQPIAPQFAIMIASFVSLAAANALIYALLADKLRRQIARPKVIRNLTRFGGVALITMATMTATLRRSA
ncbi:LysE family translocator [Cognatishimia sp. SS12]|uniref:LysE family translocator n=1 Tax=Cognatishimia sp. SS12 TaxID=2979465 RepID=UPI00232F5933|nr:LysE family translocator [Cognatishimia sp. SS12]MDC0736910.1 LysE family translocator [Cognatishimia sp. SS12]